MNFRKRVVKVVTFIGGLYFFLKFVLPKEFIFPGFATPIVFGHYHEQIVLGLNAMGLMSFGLGIGNLVMRHASTVVYAKKGALNSVALLAGLVTILLVSVFQWREASHVSARAERLFMLRDFTERIVTDASTVPPPPGVPAVPQRIEALVNAASEALREVQGELGNARGEVRAEARVADELRALAEGATAKVAALPREPSAAGEWNFGALAELGKSLAEVGAKRSEFLTLSGKGRTTEQVYGLLFNGVFLALGSAMFSLLGFYIASAAYRAFRLRSVESGLMMSAALLVILGQIPFMLLGDNPLGEWFHEFMPRVRLWLLTVPNSAAFRAIEIGVAVGGLVQAFRMWLSIESESFTTAKEEKR